MSRIKTLTAAQIGRMPEFVRRWTDIGLSTAPTDRVKAEAAIRLMYECGGLPPPREIVWNGSPLSSGIARSLWDSVGATSSTSASSSWVSMVPRVGESVRATVRENVVARVGTSVGARVGTSVVESVEESVEESVRARVGARVGEIVRENVGESVRTRVRESVRENVVEIVVDSVRTRVGTRVEEIVRESIGDNVWTSVVASMGESVVARVGEIVRARVRENLVARVWNSVVARVGVARVRESVRENVGARVGNSVGESVVARVVDSVRRTSVRENLVASVWSSVRESVYGNHDAGWLSFYSYFREVCGLAAITDPLRGLFALAETCGWCIPHANVCFASDRPILLARDGQGRLHSGDDMAIRYPDGWGVYAWHGVRMPARYIAERDKVTAQEILKEANVEVRRCAMEMYGQGRFAVDAGAEVVSTDASHGAELMVLPLPADDPERIMKALRLTDPTTGHVYLERVPPDVETAIDALSWRFRVKPENYQPQWEC